MRRTQHRDSHPITAAAAAIVDSSLQRPVIPTRAMAAGPAAAWATALPGRAIQPGPHYGRTFGQDLAIGGVLSLSAEYEGLV